MIEQIEEQFNKLSLHEMAKCLENLQISYSKKLYSDYKLICVFNYSGNITSLINKETGFESYHKSSNGGIGRNIIMIPTELYTDELANDLITKYNDVI